MKWIKLSDKKKTPTFIPCTAKRRRFNNTYTLENAFCQPRFRSPRVNSHQRTRAPRRHTAEKPDLSRRRERLHVHPVTASGLLPSALARKPCPRRSRDAGTHTTSRRWHWFRALSWWPIANKEANKRKGFIDLLAKSQDTNGEGGSCNGGNIWLLARLRSRAIMAWRQRCGGKAGVK